MAPKDPKLELLKSIPLFAGLDHRDLERVGGIVDEIDLPAGRVLMRQGARGDEMFVVVSGRFAVDRDGARLAERGPGDSLGEIALVSEGPRTATVTALEPSRVFVIGHRGFHDLMAVSPSIQAHILEVLAGRLRSLELDAAH